MSEPEKAQRLFEKALHDFRALENMLSSDAFADEIFGFHAQQAIEKAFKTWLIVSGASYPRIHDLRRLLQLIEEKVQHVPEEFWESIDLTDFAAEFRYDFLESIEEDFDRVAIVRKVKKIIDHVQSLLR